MYQFYVATCFLATLFSMLTDIGTFLLEIIWNAETDAVPATTLKSIIFVVRRTTGSTLRLINLKQLGISDFLTPKLLFSHFKLVQII
jgi:hypothetical protein